MKGVNTYAISCKYCENLKNFKMEKYNLANLKIKELPYSETKNTSGGIAGTIAVIGACIYLFNNRKDFVAGIKDGFNGVEYNY